MAMMLHGAAGACVIREPSVYVRSADENARLQSNAACRCGVSAANTSSMLRSVGSKLDSGVTLQRTRRNFALPVCGITQEIETSQSVKNVESEGGDEIEDGNKQEMDGMDVESSSHDVSEWKLDELMASPVEHIQEKFSHVSEFSGLPGVTRSVDSNLDSGVSNWTLQRTRRNFALPVCGITQEIETSQSVENVESDGGDEIEDGNKQEMDIESSSHDASEWKLEEFRKLMASPVEHIKEKFSHVSEFSGLPRVTRRRVLGAPMFMSFMCALGLAVQPAKAWFPANIDSTKAPSHPFDASDQRLRDAATIFEKGLVSKTVEEEEELWTVVIEKCEGIDAEWVSDILSRAYGNRGNSRSRQGKLQEALKDYDRAILLAPYAADPVLNRGVALESLKQFEQATADYQAVLRNQPDDPAAWNNLGNVQGALGRWEKALKCYGQAVKLSPQFSFAAANYALALYEVGKENEAIRQFRSLLRRYPEFPDIRAALAVTLYAQGLRGEAETNWTRLEDGRYKDRSWIRNTRRWPPKLVNALEAFLDIQTPA